MSMARGFGEAHSEWAGDPRTTRTAAAAQPAACGQNLHYRVGSQCRSPRLRRPAKQNICGKRNVCDKLDVFRWTKPITMGSTDRRLNTWTQVATPKWSCGKPTGCI